MFILKIPVLFTNNTGVMVTDSKQLTELQEMLEAEMKPELFQTGYATCFNALLL